MNQQQQSLTQKWLLQNIAPYGPHKDRVYADVDRALARFPTLHPKSDIYTHDDGRTQLLLCVHGLLPISYRQAEYNIPVALWLTRDYPSQPPIVYVVPTSDMLVKPGTHADVSGRINIDYIQHWLRKSEPCHLSGLLEAMQHHFSRDSPVYAKPKTTVSDPQTPIPVLRGYAAKPPPPLPSSHPPPLPPTIAVPTDRPSLPPKPPSLPTSPPPVSSQRWSTPLSPPPLPAPVLPPTTLSNPPIQTPQPPLVPSPNLLDEEYADLSTLHTSAPPPPRPTNPELLRLHTQVHQMVTAEFASLSQALAIDAERLRAQQTDLLAGEPAIRDEMARLVAVRDVCRNVAARIRTSVDHAEGNIAELRRKGDPEVDELVCSTSIVHNQLIELVAEDNAIEDTIYHLHRALNSGRIDLERFLRTTRVLAEEQFMKRALIEKIQTGLPIGASMGSEWSFSA